MKRRHLQGFSIKELISSDSDDGEGDQANLYPVSHHYDEVTEKELRDENARNESLGNPRACCSHFEVADTQLSNRQEAEDSNDDDHSIVDIITVQTDHGVAEDLRNDTYLSGGDQRFGGQHVDRGYESSLSELASPNLNSSNTSTSHHSLDQDHDHSPLLDLSMSSPLIDSDGGEHSDNDDFPDDSMDEDNCSAKGSDTNSEMGSKKGRQDSNDFEAAANAGKKMYRCTDCKYITDRKNNLKRHIVTMHEECQKSLECCDQVFPNKAAMREHVIARHKHGYDCKICGRNFCRKALLKRHITVHSGQKDYVCHVCGYATSHKSNLDRHKRRHLPKEGTPSHDKSGLQQMGLIHPIAAAHHHHHHHHPHSHLSPAQQVMHLNKKAENDQLALYLQDRYARFMDGKIPTNPHNPIMRDRNGIAFPAPQNATNIPDRPAFLNGLNNKWGRMFSRPGAGGLLPDVGPAGLYFRPTVPAGHVPNSAPSSMPVIPPQARPVLFPHVLRPTSGTNFVVPTPNTTSQPKFEEEIEQFTYMVGNKEYVSYPIKKRKRLAPTLYKCKFCDQVFTNQLQLNLHTDMHHAIHKPEPQRPLTLELKGGKTTAVYQ